jgi:4-diphosphocytidyl-2-C-methyl-D-erythritol kinase
MPGPREFAPAKVNLTLHVTGRRPDGYHLLDSLVVFPRVGDLLKARAAAATTLSVDGPFAAGLEAADNLVLRAAALLAGGARHAALRLTKNLPVAGGIGGGSSDAAAALRLLARLWGLALPGSEAVLRLGADLPVCLAARSCRMSGIGEVLQPVPLPPFWLVLANPSVALATGAVFSALARRDNPAMPGAGPPADPEAFFAFVAAQRNDLVPAAVHQAPAVGATLAALAAQPGCRLARMSGSGATCFGLFAAELPARAAAAAVARAEPAWWVACAPVPDGA